MARKGIRKKNLFANILVSLSLSPIRHPSISRRYRFVPRKFHPSSPSLSLPEFNFPRRDRNRRQTKQKLHSFEGIEAHETRRVYETGEIEWTLPGLTSFDGRQREAGGGVTKQRYTRGKGGGGGGGGRVERTLYTGRIVENKKRPISWGYLVGSGYAVLSFFLSFFLFCFVLLFTRRREKEEKIFITRF